MRTGALGIASGQNLVSQSENTSGVTRPTKNLEFSTLVNNSGDTTLNAPVINTTKPNPNQIFNLNGLKSMQTIHSQVIPSALPMSIDPSPLISYSPLFSTCFTVNPLDMRPIILTTPVALRFYVTPDLTVSTCSKIPCSIQRHQEAIVDHRKA